MYVWPSEPIQMPDGNECKGWAYVGSANISESAWSVYFPAYLYRLKQC